jgi:hypothetical protein
MVGCLTLRHLSFNPHLTLRRGATFIHEGASNCPETLTIFALKPAHLPRIMHIGTKFPGKAAPHQVYCF